MTIEWPEVEGMFWVLYEHDDPACPERLLLCKRDDETGYVITIQAKGEPAPPLTKEDVLDIADKLIDGVSVMETY